MSDAVTTIEVDPWFPALVLGTSAPPARLRGPPPPWLLRAKHQFGGHACRQAELLGVFMPLAERAGASSLLEGFEALASDSPREKPIRQHPELAPLHLTFGEPYNAVQLECLQRFLDHASPPLPKARAGAEALVRLDASPEALASLRGSPVLCPELAPGVALTDPDAADVVMGPLGVHAHATLTPALVEAANRLLGPLQLLLVWYNSD